MKNIFQKKMFKYRIQNGVYPDSLEQIKNRNTATCIYDPLLVRTDKKKNLKYNYQKIGDKYCLFSSGIDGIPNTSDDIYPDIANKDSSKLGLIRMRNK